MASSIPEQYRAVDPFASYNSNTVNQLTEMRSRAENVLDIPCGLDVVIDPISSSSVVVKPGYAFKDDVFIYVSQEHTVDFLDDDHYVTTPIPGEIAADTYCYIVLQYTYIKSRPAPQANIKIVTPNNRNNYVYGSSSTSLVFLKAVHISSVGPIVIDTLHDFDPTPGYEDNKREFAKQYAGAESNFDPTDYDDCEDRGRFAYDLTKDEFWFGYEDRWERLNVAGTFNIDTTAADAGDLCYVDLNGQAAPAIATSIDTAAELIVIEVGVSADGTGQARLNGYVEGVNVEAGNSPSIGDLLYLSDSLTDQGTVTNERTDPFYQVVGRAVSAESASKVNILFFGRAVQESFNIDTASVSIGDLCYVDGSGDAAAAIATSLTTGAEMVIEVAGQARLNGYIKDVNVEAGNSPSIGDLLYLSDSLTDQGTVTDIQTSPLSQVVGRAVSDEAGLKVDILFFARAVLETGTAARVTDTLSGGDWSLVSGSYRGDVDISALGITGQDVVVSCRDISTNMVVSPQDIDLSVANTVRIWTTADSVDVDNIELLVTVVG